MSDKKTIRGAIFDVDGVLIDSMFIWEGLADRYLATQGKTAEPDIYEKLANHTMEEGAAYMKEQYGLADTPEKIKADCLSIIESFYRFEVEAKPGAKEILKEFQDLGIPMVIASAGDNELMEAALTRLGMWEYFKTAFTCTVLETSKREPRIYLTCADYLGLDPDEIVVFEDVIHAVTTAKNAGFFTVGMGDASSAADREAIRNTADLFLENFGERKLLAPWLPAGE